MFKVWGSRFRCLESSSGATRLFTGLGVFIEATCRTNSLHVSESLAVIADTGAEKHSLSAFTRPLWVRLL